MGSSVTSRFKKRSDELYAKAHMHAVQVLSSMRCVAGHSNEEKAFEEFDHEVKATWRVANHTARVAGLNVALMMFTTFASYQIGFW